VWTAAAGVELNIWGGFFATSALELLLMAFADFESGAAAALSSMTISPSEPGESGALRGAEAAAAAITIGRFSLASSNFGFLGLSEFFDVPSEEDEGAL